MLGGRKYLAANVCQKLHCNRMHTENHVVPAITLNYRLWGSVIEGARIPPCRLDLVHWNEVLLTEIKCGGVGNI